MLKPFVFVLPLMAALAGCAHLPQFAAQPRDADCRHVVSPDGEPLRFCETDKRVTVDRVSPPETAAAKRMIDDPQFLAAMIDQLPRIEKGDGAGLRGKDRICSAATPGYITIRVSDFSRMTGRAPAAPNASALTTRERIASAE